MHLKFQNIHRLSLLILSTELFFLVEVNSVKIKSGKVTTTTTTHSPNSLQPKFNPSQQIVTDLLTPQFANNHLANNQYPSQNVRTKGGGVRKNKKGKQHGGVGVGVDISGGNSAYPQSSDDKSISYTSTSTAWNLEHPLVPPQGGEWNLNLSQVPTIATTLRGDLNVQPHQNQPTPGSNPGGVNSFTFSTTNLADSTWVGLSETKTSSSGPSPGETQPGQLPQPPIRSPANSANLNLGNDLPSMHYTTSQDSVNANPNRILYIPETVDDDDDDPDYDDADDDESNSVEEPKKKLKRNNQSKKTKKSKSQKSSRKDLNINSTDEGTMDAKFKKMEDLVQSLSKNVDVMRQNTQVISKGFNILSTRFNKLSSDQDELNLKLDKKFVLVEEGIIRMQKEVGKKLKEIEAKGESNFKNLKKTDHDLIETQVANAQEHKKWMETLSGKVVNFKSEFDKESKVLAEMVKALAEIQKKEKGKLDNLGKNLNTEMGKLKETLAQSNLEDDNENREREKNFQERVGQDSQLAKRVEKLESKLESTQSSTKNESDLFKRELGDLSKYVEDKLKRLDESLQEQNMAHNMAHEHISAKMEDLSNPTKSSSTSAKHPIFGRGDDQAVQEMIETSPIYPLVLDRLTRLEHNYTKIDERMRQTGEKVESMEDTDLSILSRIADLRNSQALEINWTKGEISRISQNLNETQEKVRELGETREKKSNSRKDPELLKLPHPHPRPPLLPQVEEQDNMLMEVGGLSMTDPTFEPPRTEPAPQSLLRTTIYFNNEGNEVGPPSSTFDSNLNSANRGGQGQSQGQGQLSERMESVEENVAELWRSQTESKAVSQNVQELIANLQENQVKSQENSQIQLKHFEDATKLLRDMLRNSTYKINAIQRQMAELEEQIKSKTVTDRRGQSAEESSETTTAMDEQVSGRVKTVSTHQTPLIQEDVILLREEIQGVRDIVDNLLSSNKNVTKAQEFFLLKLLEMDQEHKKDNRTLAGDLYSLRNETEDTFLEISRSEDRLNKVVQQFTITDAEQVKIREELWNIKDRLNGLEENYVNLWKTNKKFLAELEQVVNSVDNINLVHGSELQTLSTDLGLSKEKFENVTKHWRNLDNRLSNVELLMDMEVGNEPNTSELGKLKQRLSGSEKDIAELWKSSEILSFQQQVMAENFKFLEATHENYTAISSADRGSTKKDAYELMSLYQNLTKRVSSVEKITNPLYETKTINFMIPDWAATSASEFGLRDEFLEYELGSSTEGSSPGSKKPRHRSSWKTYLSLNGTHLSIFNILVKADSPMFNEFEVQVLDGDGRVFTTAGPEQHLYKKRGDSFTVSNIISRQTLENPKFGLLSRNTLRLKVKVRIYPKYELDEVENVPKTPSEKQLVLWEVKGLGQILDEIPKSEDLFQELNVTKEFVAGHSWNGFSLWKAGLLVKTINRQVYLGLNVELVQRDGDWKELEASYNITMLDAHSRIAKEFSISPNDFISVSARHSYFMLVKDVEDILSRGDVLTFRIYFDLQAKRKAYDVEVIG